jgi:hypothetical protein
MEKLVVFKNGLNFALGSYQHIEKVVGECWREQWTGGTGSQDVAEAAIDCPQNSPVGNIDGAWIERMIHNPKEGSMCAVWSIG